MSQDLDDFAARWIEKLSPAELPRQPRVSFLALWLEVATRRGLEMTDIPGRRGETLVLGAGIARVELCQRAMVELGMSAAEIARELRVSPSTVQIASRGYVGGKLAKTRLAPPIRKREAS